MTKVLLTGATGFLGRHTLPELVRRYGAADVAGVSSLDYDLMSRHDVERMFADHKPEILVHLAAYSGGIGANRQYPADFYFRNTILTAEAFEAASRHKVRRMVYTMGGCSYPAHATSPIDETQLWTGYPQEESAGYSTAKMMGIVAARSYRTQYGLNSTVLIPGNMYGEYDNFRLLESHVVPAMIRRYHEAELSGAKRVTMWGTGEPCRDFVYAGDVARLIPDFIERTDQPGPINISSGTRTSIRELAETIAALVGFRGEIEWDTCKPDGQMVKIFDTSRLATLGMTCETTIRDGLAKTIAWFRRAYGTGEDGIRL